MNEDHQPDPQQPPAAVPGNLVQPAVSPTQPIRDSQTPFTATGALGPGPITTQPMPAVGVVSPAAVPKRRSWKKLVFSLIGVLIVLGGGGAAAYYGYYVPNQPNNVVYKALAGFVDSADSDHSFNFTDNTTFRGGASSSPLNIAVNGGVDANSNIRADAEVNYSAFKITLSSIVRTGGKELYLKVNELPSLLRLYGGGDPALQRLATRLDKNWLRLDVPDLKAAGLITDKQATDANKCINALSDYFTGQKDTISSSITQAYTKDEFMTATKAGSDTVNGQAATKYSLAIDKTKASQFLKDLDDSLTASSKSLDTACSATATTPNSDQEVNNTNISNVYVWVNQHKQLVKASATVTDGTSTNNLAATFSNKKPDTARPDNVLTIKDLQTEIKQIFGGQTIQALAGDSSI